jgi:hypothetical protein
MDELNPAAGDPVGLRDHPECNFVRGPSFGMVEVRNLISCWGQLLGVNRIPMLCNACACLFCFQNFRCWVQTQCLDLLKIAISLQFNAIQFKLK